VFRWRRASQTGPSEHPTPGARLTGGGETLFRKLTLSGLLGLLGIGALAAGAQSVTLVVLGALVVLAWVGLGRRGRD
jgi:hypothetical protein